MKPIIIAIDGPAASGKGTISKYIKKKFNFYHIDSGLLYRKLAKKILDHQIDLDLKELENFLKKIKDISSLSNSGLRKSKISKTSSKIAKIKKIRDFINLSQKKIVKKNAGKHKGFVVDGRDIGSVVFKDANIKLYINSNIKIRAKRRYKELIDMGEKSIYSNVLKEIKLRDKEDKSRKYSPLVIPKDAIIINNTINLKDTKKIINKIISEII